MSNIKFENVSVQAKANIYFDGKVVSHSIQLADGTKKTIGIIYPGNFHFKTQSAELMEIISGKCRVKILGAEAWNTLVAGEAFEVSAHSAFDIEVSEGVAEYICTFS